MNINEISTIMFYLISILVLTCPNMSQADPQLQIHRTYKFSGSEPYLASPLVIIDSEEQYKDFIENAHIYKTFSLGKEIDSDDSSYEHPQIDFQSQCLILLNAPGLKPPKVKSTRHQNDQIILDIEYSEDFSLGNGWFNCKAIHIDRPNSSIKLSENSLRQHENIYGTKLKLYRNSLNLTIDEEVMKTCQKSIDKIYEDILKLKPKFSELQNFDEQNAWKSRETNEIIWIEYRNNVKVIPKRDIIPEKDGIWLRIFITYPIVPHEFVHQLSNTFEIEYINICARVNATIHTNNKLLEKNLLNLIKSRVEPLARYDKKAL